MRLQSMLKSLSPSTRNTTINNWLKSIGFTPITLYKDDENTKEIWTEFENLEGSKTPDDEIQVIKVEFEKFCSILPTKKIQLRDGYFYIKLNNSFYHDIFLLFFVEHFETRQKEILSILRKIPIELDIKLKNELQTLQNNSIGDKSTFNFTNIETDEIQNYPLCMKYIHNHLTKYNHLKHQARLQYMLFLKGIGYSLDKSIEFWKSSIYEGSYKKNNLTYIIRHAYGKEGHRIEKPPYNCKSIKEFNVSYDSEHGCPFKHKSLGELIEMFDKDLIPKSVQQEIILQIQNGKYGTACKLYGNALYKEEIFENEITSPNQYYEIVDSYKREEQQNDYKIFI